MTHWWNGSLAVHILALQCNILHQPKYSPIAGRVTRLCHGYIDNFNLSKKCLKRRSYVWNAIWEIQFTRSDKYRLLVEYTFLPSHIPPHSPSIPLLPGQSHDQALGDMAVLHISVSAWFAEHSGLYKIWVHSHLKQKYFLHYTFSLASFSGWRHEKRWTFLLTPESVNLIPERWCKAVITCNTDFNLLTKIFYFWYLILELPNKDAIAVFTWGQKILTEREKCQLSPFLAAFPKNLSPA